MNIEQLKEDIKALTERLYAFEKETNENKIVFTKEQLSSYTAFVLESFSSEWEENISRISFNENDIVTLELSYYNKIEINLNNRFIKDLFTNETPSIDSNSIEHLIEMGLEYVQSTPEEN